MQKVDTDKLRKASEMIYLIVDLEVAKDLSEMLRSVADEIERLRKEAQNPKENHLSD